MAKNGSGGASVLVAAGFVLILVVLTFSTIYFFWARTWWMPPAITPLGEELDAQFVRTLLITGLVFLLSQMGLAYAILRFRDRGGRAVYSHGSLMLEYLWTAATLIMFVGLGIYAERSWAAFHLEPAAAGAVQVEITGQQFAWNFRYPGQDGTWGRTRLDLISDATGNPLGLDYDGDPAAKDDILSPIIAVPVNRQVEVLLRTKDVTHSFFVRELRFKQDTVPGLTIRLHFTATQTGTYEVACAELCGLGHHRMRTELVVVPEAEYHQITASQEAFDNWLNQRRAAAAAAGAP